MAVENRKYDPTYLKISIKYKEPFDFRKLYEKMLYWCQNEGYTAKGAKTNSGKENHYEVLYHERTYPGFKELWCTWELHKDFDKYIGHDMNISIQILGMADTEVVIDGKKKKMDIGELIIEINGEIVFDPKMEKEWNKDLFNRWPFTIVKRLFKIRTIKDKLDFWEDKSFSKHHSFAEFCKSSLQIKI